MNAALAAAGVGAAAKAGVTVGRIVGAGAGAAVGAGAGQEVAGPAAEAAAAKIEAGNPDSIPRKVVAGALRMAPAALGAMALNPAAVRGAWNAVRGGGVPPIEGAGPAGLPGANVIDEAPKPPPPPGSNPQPAPNPIPKAPNALEIQQKLRGILGQEPIYVPDAQDVGRAMAERVAKTHQQPIETPPAPSGRDILAPQAQEPATGPKVDLETPAFQRKPLENQASAEGQPAPEAPAQAASAKNQGWLGKDVILEGQDKLGPGKVIAQGPAGVDVQFEGGRTIRTKDLNALSAYVPPVENQMDLLKPAASVQRPVGPAPLEPTVPAPVIKPQAPLSAAAHEKVTSAMQLMGNGEIPAEATGRAGTVLTPVGRHKVAYKLVSLGDLKTSHDPLNGYMKTPDYPQWVQPRDYAGNRGYQLDVEANSASDRFDPAGQIFDTTSSAISGPPIIMKDGTVLGGNGRTMTMKLAQQRPETAARYKQALEEAAANFGIDKAEIERMYAEGKTPVIAREYQGAPEDVQKLRQLGEEFNKDIKKTADPAEQAFTRGSLISEDSLNKISEAIGEHESLNEALATANGSSAVARALLDDRVISQNELNSWIDKKTATFNEAGKAMVRDAVAARLLGDANLFRVIPGGFKDRLVKAAGELVKIEAGQPEWRIADNLRGGIEWILTQKANGVSEKAWFDTQDMFRTLTPDEKTMAQLMQKPAREFQQRMKMYAEYVPREIKSQANSDQAGFDFLSEIPEQQPKAALPQAEAFQKAFVDPLPPKGQQPAAGPVMGADIFPGARQAYEYAKRLMTGQKVMELKEKMAAPALELMRKTSELENKKIISEIGAIRGVNETLGLPEHRGELKGPIGTLKFLADPSFVIPKLANQAGRVFDAMNKTKTALFQEIGDAVKGLTKEDHFQIYEALDGQVEAKDLQPKLQQPYQRLRAVLDNIAEMEGLGVGQRIANYFPHISEKNGTIALPEDGVFVAPSENPFHKHRAGNTDFTYDLLDALTVRASVGVRKAYMKPFVETVMPRLEELPENLKKYAESYMDVLLGRPRPITQRLDWLMGQISKNYTPGKLGAWQMRLNLQYYRGLLGLAYDTALKNLAQGSNTVAELGFKKVASGMFDMMTSKGRDAFRQGGVLDDYLNVVEQQANLLSKSKWTRAMDSVLFAPMKFSEYVNRGVAFNAGMAKAYDLGLRGQEAVAYAKFVVDKTQFRYGASNTSPYLQNPLGKTFMQFSTYPLKQSQLLMEWAKDPNKMKLARYLAFTGLVTGLGAAAGVNLAQMVGWNWHDVPFTGDKARGKQPWRVPLPSGPTAQLLGTAATVFSAPVPKAAFGAMSLLGQELKQGKMDPNDLRELGKNLRNLVPGMRIAHKISDFAREQKTGYGWNANGHPIYPISSGESAVKMLGFQPKVTEDYYATHGR